MDEATLKIDEKELIVVHSRVGRDWRTRLQWALDFAQRDLDALEVGEWCNLQWELFAFSKYRPTVGTIQDVGLLDALKNAGHQKIRFPQKVQLPSKRRIREAQIEFRRIVEELLRHRHVLAGPLELRYWVICDDTAADLSVETKGGVEGLEVLIHLLGAYAHLIRLCGERGCRHWFVARTNQHFCSTRCQSRHTSREKRKRDRQTDSSRLRTKTR